jgi:hypothetical protein
MAPKQDWNLSLPKEEACLWPSHSCVSGVYFEAVDATPFVDRDGDDPTNGEESDDEVAEGAEVVVEPADEVPESSLQVKLLRHETECFDTADCEGNHNRYEGDGDVVVELANGFYEGPAVGSEHQDGVGGVDERHACGEEGREDEDRPERKAFGCLGSRDAEDADLGGGVEAEAEEHAQGIHVPAARDHLEHGAEEAGEQATVAEEQIEVFFDVRLAAPDAHEGADHRAENDKIDDCNGEEKDGRDERADYAADISDGVDAVVQGERGGGDGSRAHYDDGGMSKREHEADGDGTFAFVHELASDVVDRGDVVGIDCVAEAETVGEECGAEKQRIGVKGDDGPEPHGQVEHQQQTIYADYLGSGVACFVVEQEPRERWHRVYFLLCNILLWPAFGLKPGAVVPPDLRCWFNGSPKQTRRRSNVSRSKDFRIAALAVACFASKS